MKRLLHILLSSVLFTGAVTASASTQWTVQGKTYTVDTVYHAKVGPGTTHTALQLSGAAKIELVYTTSELNNPNLDFRVTKGGNVVYGLSTLSAMQKKATSPQAEYFIGVNCDFFTTSGLSCASSMVDGEAMYLKTTSSRDVWYGTTDHKYGIGNIKYSATATCGELSTRLHAINFDRSENFLVLYTPKMVSNTRTNAYGVEVPVELVSGKLGYGTTATFKVCGEKSTAGSMPLNGKYVLSGHGTSADFINALPADAVITIESQKTYPQSGELVNMAGGCPMILENGEVLNTESALDHLPAKHPRTCVGFSADSTKMVMMVLDGRSIRSVGATSKELAEIMRYVGCAHAMNFDGGGSSEMYSSALGVRNKPSDGQERSVVNALWAVATGEEDNEVAELSFEYFRPYSMPRYGYFTPVIYAYNKAGRLIDKDFKGYTLECDATLGTIVDDGKTLLANGTGSHTLTARYGNASASIGINIGSAPTRFLSNSIVLDEVRSYTVEVGSDIEGQFMYIDNKALNWSSDNPAVATVDADGTVRGVGEGSTLIRGTLGDYSGELKVDVQIPASRYLCAVESLAPEKWTVTKYNVDVSSMHQTAEGLEINFSIKTARSPYIQLKQASPMYALPDSLRLVMERSDSTFSIPSVNVSLTPNGAKGVNVEHEIAASGELKQETVFGMNEFFDSSVVTNYPVKFGLVKINISGNVGEAHKLIIRNLDGVYAHKEDNSGISAPVCTDEAPLALRSNSVAAGQILELINPSAPRCEIFTAAGALVAEYPVQSATAPSATGIYILRCGRQSAIFVVK